MPSRLNVLGWVLLLLSAAASHQDPSIIHAPSLTSKSKTISLQKRQLLGACQVYSMNNRCVATGVTVLGLGLLCSCTNCAYLPYQTCMSTPGATYNVASCTCTVPSGSARKRNVLTLLPDGTIDVQPSRKALSPLLRRELCPGTQMACRVLHKTLSHRYVMALGEQYECLDVESEMESCGGCVSEGEGIDCTEIPDVEDVECREGHCVVLACEGELVPDVNGTECAQDSTPRRGFRRRGA